MTNLEAVAVEVSAGASGTATLTFTADDYATAMVEIRTDPARATGRISRSADSWSWGEQANRYYGGNGDDHDRG